MGVQGIPPEWDKATSGNRPKRSLGVEGSVCSGTQRDDLIVAGRGPRRSGAWVGATRCLVLPGGTAYA